MDNQKSAASWKNMEARIQKAKDQLKVKEKASHEDIVEILRKRAEELALFEDRSKKQTKTIGILEFTLGQESYAIKVEHLKEVIDAVEITEIPCTPQFIYGVINLRGKIVTVIDLKKFLQLNYVGINDHSSIIVAEHNNLFVGIVTDKVIGVKDIAVDNIQKTKPELKNIKESYIYGITNDTVIILEIENLLSDKALLVNEGML